MNNQNYEDYMRSVLGYSPTYANSNNEYMYSEQEDLYDNQEVQNPIQETTQDLTEFYPEIYKIIYPCVCKLCNVNSTNKLTKELLEQMTDEIYRNVEPEDNVQTVRQLPPLKNGDVRNPNAKEEFKDIGTRQNNYLLRDLIRILLLREWGRPPRPPMGPGGPGIPPRPPRPPMGPPPPRPKYY